MVKTDLEKFKSRWRRFVGQKTRVDKPYWTTLLDNKWMSWAQNIVEQFTFDVFVNHGIELELSKVTPLDLRVYFNIAIDCATMRDLIKLDNIYCQEVLIGN